MAHQGQVGLGGNDIAVFNFIRGDDLACYWEWNHSGVCGLRTESEKKAWAEERKRLYAEKVRLKEKVWTYVEVCRLVSKWVGGSLQERFLEYTVLWKWLGIKGKKEDRNIELMLVTEGGVKLSLEYLRRVHDDEMGDYQAKGLRESCGVKMDDYLLWSESELAEFIFRCEQLIETERMERQTHLVRKKLIEGLKGGDKKSMQMFLEMTGRDKAGEPEKEGFTMKVVDKYDVHSDEAVPGEIKVLKMNGGIPIEPLGTGQQEASSNL